MKEITMLIFLMCIFSVNAFSQIQSVKLEGYFLPKNKKSDVKSELKEFANLQHLALSSTSVKNISGFVVTKSGSFKIISPKLRGAEFDFKTQTINGISYSFAGKFVMTDFSNSTEESEILSGVLFKYRKGKMIASVYSDFDYWVGD